VVYSRPKVLFLLCLQAPYAFPATTQAATTLAQVSYNNTHLPCYFLSSSLWLGNEQLLQDSAVRQLVEHCCSCARGSIILLVRR
jgi:hypothetical protein